MSGASGCVIGGGALRHHLRPAAWPLIWTRRGRTARLAIVEFDELRDGHVLGVDLNADHLAACVLDSSGNPSGRRSPSSVDTAGLPARRRDGRVRAAITTSLDLAVAHNCTAVVVENLDFADARCAGRETLGRGRRGKRLRRTIAGIPTAKFRSRLTSMASRRSIAVIGVTPPTPACGRQHWRTLATLPTRSSPLTSAAASATFDPSSRVGGKTVDPIVDSLLHLGHLTSRRPRLRVLAHRRAHHDDEARRPPENTHRQRPTPFGRTGLTPAH